MKRAVNSFDMLFFTLLANLFSNNPSHKIFTKSNQRLTFAPVSGDYANNNWVNNNKINPSQFTYTSNGDKDDHPLSYAFNNPDTTQEDPNIYWVSKEPVTESSPSSIFITFEQMATVRGFLYSPAFRTRTIVRYFDGFPLTLKIYSSQGDGPYTLNDVFSGPVPTSVNWDRTQFIFSNPIQCSKLLIEICEASPDGSFSGNKTNAVAKEFIFIGEINKLAGEAVKGVYADNNYITLHEVPTNEFTYESTGSEKQGFPLSNAFDNNFKTYWSALYENNQTFKSSIIITFNEPKTIEAVLLDSAFSTKTIRRFDGYPTTFNIYTTLGQEPYKLGATFEQNPSAVTWNRTQFAFTNPILCKKLKLEFAEVTPDASFSNSQKCAVVSGLFFIERFVPDRGQWQKPFSPYDSTTYVNNHLMEPYLYRSTGDKEGHPISLAFDPENTNTYWVSDKPVSESSPSSIFITFKKACTINAFLIDTAFRTLTVREFDGFPLKLNIYTSYMDSPFTLNAVFTGDTPTQKDLSKFLYVFNYPIRCDKVQVEFVEVTPDGSFSANAKHAVVRTILFVGEPDVDFIESKGVEGIYNNPSYVNAQKIKSSTITRSSSGDMNNYPLSNLFDDKTNTFWNSDKINTDDFHATINVAFQTQVTLDAILMRTTYNSSGQIRTFNGFPTVFKVFASKETSGDFQHQATFIGELEYPTETVQFPFKTPLNCRRLKLEFADVTPNLFFAQGAKLASASLLQFLNEPPSPPPLPELGGSIELSPEQCNNKYQCRINITNDKQYNIIIRGSTFSGYRNTEANGGAISLVNTGSIMENVEYRQCESSFGGGAIFYQNKLEQENNFVLRNINFYNCKAVFGGGAYIYSKQALVEIDTCNFNNNELLPPGQNSGNFYGGSALYMSTLHGTTSQVTFNGCHGTVVKINTDMNARPALSSSSHSSKGNQKSVLFSHCTFNADESTTSSIYYIRGKSDESLFKVSECVFKGQLSKGAHHIDGKFASNIAPKLLVTLCKFSTNSKNALNFDPNNDYLSINLNDQIFNSNFSYHNESNNNIWKIIVTAALPAEIIIALIVMILFIKNKKNSNMKEGIAAEAQENSEKEAISPNLI